MNNIMFNGGINSSNSIEFPKHLSNELEATFGPIVESIIGSDYNKLTEDRKSFIARLAHNQYTGVNDSLINESSSFSNAGYSTPTNTLGMGAPSFGTTLGGQTNFNTGTAGSGDKWISPFAVAMQVAAKTIAFELVPTIPISAPTGSVYYIDYQYSDGKLLGTGNDNPILIKLNTPSGFTGVKGSTYIITSAFSAPTASGNAVRLKFVGKTRIMGHSIFQVLGSGTATSNVVTETETVKISDAITGTANLFITGANAYVANTASPIAITASADLVNAFEDQVYGFAGGKGGYDNFNFDGNFNSTGSGSSLYSGYGRNESEEAPFRTMGLKNYAKYVETQEFKIKLSITPQMIQDLKRVHNFDALGKAENALVNETSQNINRNIINTLYAMGWTNHVNLLAAEGENLNINLKSGDTGAAAVTYVDNTASAKSIAMPDFINYSGSTSSFENRATLVERLVSKIRYASMLIEQRGRRGPATFVVTNVKLAAAIKSISGFTFNPFENNFKVNSGLYPIGTFEGLTLYVDPYEKADSGRVLVGRKGADDEPGLKFLPYVLSESISTVAEATMSAVIANISRYAIVEYGQFPETQYLTFQVKADTGGLI